jgi:mannose-6-phosphate isomerase-like protein (cupin superfamily)
MSVARHPRPPELEGMPVEEIMQKYVGRFREKKPDWAAFEDARIEGYKRAQHRFIGAGGSGKHNDPSVIPAKNFTLSIMYVEPGQGNAAHTHEVEECFFVLQGFLDVFVEDEAGHRVTTRLGPWECIACPAGVIHGYQNDSLAPVYFQVMLGRGRPETMGYADDELYKRRDAHLKAVWGSPVSQIGRRTDRSTSSCPALCRASTSFLVGESKARRGWPGQARP